MIPTTKCLWTVICTTLITILTEQIISCSPTFGSQSDNSLNSVDREPAENDDLKRDWSKFASWGKRGFKDNFAVWGKRSDINDDEFAQMTPDKKDWSKFASWGKRDDLIDNVKREWSKSFSLWGKRSPENLQGDDVERDYTSADDLEKKWSQIAPWGKRDYTGDMTDVDKRKWSKFASWGKRGDEFESDMDKRKWNQLSPAWGKRDYVSESPEKREWSKFASWGKRLRRKPWVSALEPWGKRRWTGITTWGKRSVDSGNNKSKDMAEKLLNLFDLNGRYRYNLFLR